MMLTIVLLAVAVALAGGYAFRGMLRRTGRGVTPASPRASAPGTADAAVTPTSEAAQGSVTVLRALNTEVAERLWRHAFGAATPLGGPEYAERAPGGEHPHRGGELEDRGGLGLAGNAYCRYLQATAPRELASIRVTGRR
jgi:hypothetical protein